MTFTEQAMTAFRRGDSDEVVRLATLELARARAIGEARGEVDALSMLSRVSIRNDELDRAWTLAEQALAAAAGDTALEQAPLHILAGTARLAGDLDRARPLAAQAIAVHEALGDRRFLAIEQHNLGHLELHDGQLERARELFASARKHAAEAGADELLPELALGLAAVATVDGEFARAARILGAIDATLQAAGKIFDPDDVLEEQDIRAKLEAALGEAACAEAYRDGAADDLRVLLDHA